MDNFEAEIADTLDVLEKELKKLEAVSKPKPWLAMFALLLTLLISTCFFIVLYAIARRVCGG